MKRTELMKITVAVGILLGCMTTHGAYAVDAPKSPAAVSEAGAAKKGEAAVAGKGAVAGATDAKQGAAAEAKETKKEAAEAKETDGGFYVPMKVPLGSSLFAKIPVAIVNDDKISFGEYSDVVMSVHQALTEEKEGASSGKSLELLLNRLINIRLFVQEARNIELDQLPEVKEALDNGYKKILREVLYRRVAEKAKPDAKEVETAYKAAVKEVKLKPLEFAKEDDADNFVAAL
ncbi:MAG TPA: hypothetical protein VF775_04050, partial [Geobacteraceae bacterium]